jgi:hypothetical protein
MQCPKCRFEGEVHATECRKCGIVFAKYTRRIENLPAAKSEVNEQSQTKVADRQELFCRLLAIPSALIGARLLVFLMPAAVRMLSMWIHEAGHAGTAWLSGFSAIPGPWFTPVGSERSRLLTVLLIGLIIFGTTRAWRNRRWGLVVAGIAVFSVQLVCTFKLYSDQAQQLIIFGGDAGCFVLGSVLIATFYIRRQSIIYQNGLRWAFVVIGALTFMDAFAVWSGGIATIPFGENENGMSDPSVLTETYGWSVVLLMSRYHGLAVSCLISLAIIYIVGIANFLPAARADSRDLQQVQLDP